MDQPVVVAANTIYKYVGDTVCDGNRDFETKLLFVTSTFDKIDSWTGKTETLINFIFLSPTDEHVSLKSDCANKHLFVGHSLPVEKFLAEATLLNVAKVNMLLAGKVIALNTQAKVYFELTDENYATDSFTAYMRFMKEAYQVRTKKKQDTGYLGAPISSYVGNWDVVSKGQGQTKAKSGIRKF